MTGNMVSKTSSYFIPSVNSFHRVTKFICQTYYGLGSYGEQVLSSLSDQRNFQSQAICHYNKAIVLVTFFKKKMFSKSKSLFLMDLWSVSYYYVLICNCYFVYRSQIIFISFTIITIIRVVLHHCWPPVDKHGNEVTASHQE